MSGVRVTAGSAGRLWLKVPAGFRSRPTQDRVKQAIFSALGEMVPGARVLDLYAGCGALGIEALSRGAAAVDFVERDAGCCRTITENLAHCKLTGTVVRREAGEFVRGCAERYDIILADPPYGDDTGAVLRGCFTLLTAGGVIVWEHDGRPETAAGCVKSARYGGTTVSYFK